MSDLRHEEKSGREESRRIIYSREHIKVNATTITTRGRERGLDLFHSLLHARYQSLHTPKNVEKQIGKKCNREFVRLFSIYKCVVAFTLICSLEYIILLLSSLPLFSSCRKSDIFCVFLSRNYVYTD
jgi:hypothetical protein